ncbi:hypothetical protein DEO72_LG8g2873 [Vigna unguiculata]|uniref:Uncharacterized protein n=1 Tax=Vigna unguiculata TaxID=3917 RepID=A0A4D6MW39_VIGUN|nr:hypothetical protein DEO72_LG8g2873 [Vigna unguiculata]
MIIARKKNHIQDNHTTTGISRSSQEPSLRREGYSRLGDRPSLRRDRDKCWDFLAGSLRRVLARMGETTSRPTVASLAWARPQQRSRPSLLLA